jgi:mannosyltransferase OCH1-like enzyme
MIPKVIHYCWFGGKPLPSKAKKCIASWKQYFPNYEIKEWNETNYDVYKIPYITDAYKEKKYAFVSDYARYDILYQNGGVYFDTDVEVIKSFDIILSNGPFMGIETSIKINPGLGCAFYAEQPILNEILTIYRNLDYFSSAKNNYNVTDFTTIAFTNHGFKSNNLIQKIADTTIYPVEYFNPIDYDTHYLRKTSNTFSIHYGNASWVDGKRRLTAVIHRWLCRIFGKKTGAFFSGKIRKIAKSAFYFFTRK